MFNRRLSTVLATATLLAIAGSASAAPATKLFVQNCSPLFAPCPFAQFAIGQPAHLWVFAVDASNQLATGYAGTVSITSSAASAVLPAPHTFTAADNSQFEFTITINSVVPGSGDPAQVAVTATDTNALTGSLTFTGAAAAGVAQTPSLTPMFKALLCVLLGLAAMFAVRERSRRRQRCE